jgi:hypothetical protein
MEDKIFGNSTDPLPKDIEKKLNNETISRCAKSEPVTLKNRHKTVSSVFLCRKSIVQLFFTLYG